jgi:hypothetical protein
MASVLADFHSALGAVLEENRKLGEQNDRLRSQVIAVGCARVRDLMRMDPNELARFDSALREFRDWVLSRPGGVDDMTNGRLSSRLRELLTRFNIAYVDGNDDKRWNTDVKLTALSREQRLRALLSDRRYWIFQAADGNHETTLAIDTMVKLCEWRQLF